MPDDEKEKPADREKDAADEEAQAEVSPPSKPPADAKVQAKPEEKSAGVALPKKAWGAPLVRLDAAWTRIDARLCVWIIVTEMASIFFWVALKGLSAPADAPQGKAFRALVTAVVLGLIAHFATRKQSKVVNGVAVTAAMVGGLFLARFWAHKGIGYSSNMLNWIQHASVFMLIGGLRGLVTRLTLWLALLGASMATSRAKHINIDISARYLPKKLLVPVTLAGWLAGALVCFAGSWGFVDHISIANYGAVAGAACGEGKICDTPVSERLGAIKKGIPLDFFLLRQQLSLDLKSLPHVIKGDGYDRYMTIPEWNAWARSSDWASYLPDDAKTMIVPEDDPTQRKVPALVTSTFGIRGFLSRLLNFVFPFGLFVIGLRFVLRVLLVLSGHVKVDPDAAHSEEDLVHEHGEGAAKLQTEKV